MVDRLSRSAKLCPSLAMFALFALACAVPQAHAAFETARRSAMGDVVLVREGGGGGTNVAFRAVPALPDRPRLIPLPLGLAQLAAHPPVFDASDPNFSALAIADRLIMNPPDDLRLISPPSGEDADITVRLAEDEIILDFGTARNLVPTEPVTAGGRFSADLVSTRIAAVDFALTPLVISQSRLELSPDLTRALRLAEPVVASGVYSLEQDSESLAGLAFGVTLARQLAGPQVVVDPDLPYPDPPGLRLYGGVGARFLLGFAYFANELEGTVIPQEPLLDPDDPTQFNVSGMIRSSVAGAGGSAGQGIAFDLGLVALHGQAWEVGLGATDLASWIRWRTNLDQVVVDDNGDLRTLAVARDESYTSHLTPQLTFNVARHWGGDRTTVAADLRRGIDGVTSHLGAETRFGRYAVRGGALIDTAGRLQGSGGGGVRLGRIGIDTALHTRGANLVGDRALMLGLSLAIH